jgi:hypothetical protein
VIGVLLAAMAVSFLVTVPLWTMARPDPGSPGAAPERAAALFDTLRRPRVWLNIVLFFAYTGLEVTAGQWTYSLFTEARGIAAGAAGVWIAIYWAALIAGRVVSGALPGRLAANSLLRIGTLGALAGALLIWWDPGMGAGPAGLAALGFALAPIFPTLIAEDAGAPRARARHVGHWLPGGGSLSRCRDDSGSHRPARDVRRARGHRALPGGHRGGPASAAGSRAAALTPGNSPAIPVDRLDDLHAEARAQAAACSRTSRWGAGISMPAARNLSTTAW